MIEITGEYFVNSHLVAAEMVINRVQADCTDLLQVLAGWVTGGVPVLDNYDNKGYNFYVWCLAKGYNHVILYKTAV